MGFKDEIFVNVYQSIPTQHPGISIRNKSAKTNKYQNSCLQLALRMKRDGCKNKYTNSRRTEATTEEYLVDIQTIKKSRDKRPKRPNRLQEHNRTRVSPTVKTKDTIECEHCGLTFKTKGIKIHQTVKHKTTTAN